MQYLKNLKFSNLTAPPLNTTKLVICATAAFVLAGCQAGQLPGIQAFRTAPGPGPIMAPAQLPSAYIGDKYYYSNGSREQVASINGEMVNLINSSNRKLTNFRNFALPQPYAEGSTSEYFKKTNAPTNALWPLSVGQSARFSTDGRTVSKNSGAITDYKQKWACEVAGTEHIRILAGEFDTYRVECKRYSTTGKWWQTRTWYYAPAIGTTVLQRDYYKKGGAERILELTAVRPSLQDEPDKVRQNLIHAWQLALESKQSGEMHSWADKKTGTSVQVEPLVTYRAQ